MTSGRGPDAFNFPNPIKSGRTADGVAIQVSEDHLPLRYFFPDLAPIPMTIQHPTIIAYSKCQWSTAIKFEGKGQWGRSDYSPRWGALPPCPSCTTWPLPHMIYDHLILIAHHGNMVQARCRSGLLKYDQLLMQVARGATLYHVPGQGKQAMLAKCPQLTTLSRRGSTLLN